MENNNEKHILSFGAGLNSTALLVMLVEENYPLDEVVFADTGGEVPETYKHLKKVDSYLHKYGIPLTIVKSKNGTLYNTCKRRKVIPSQIWRWSTRDYKITPIHAHYRSFDVPVIQYLGIAYEERNRKKKSRVPYVTNVFPLIERKLDRQDCIEIIMKAGLPMPVRSGCYFCPFNSLSRWKELYTKHPDLFLKAKELEETSKHFPKQRLMKWTLGTLQKKLEKKERLPKVYVKRLCSSECII
ncbi:MAG: phosphoadenosine phosphosulfate reductase family protein [Candidatus Bathyarchaeota archaeon]|nr:MAG: phosphoadenosine phosphosulfate reductase family protein [Candidatus Bathyarchaeota archaeon]